MIGGLTDSGCHSSVIVCWFSYGRRARPPQLPGLWYDDRLLTEGTQIANQSRDCRRGCAAGCTLQAGANSATQPLVASSLNIFGDQVPSCCRRSAARPVFRRVKSNLARQTQGESQQQRAQPSLLAGETVARVMFGRPSLSLTAPSPESVEATTRERLVEFHRSTFVPNNAVLFVAGDVQQNSILQQVENLFGGWPPGNVAGDDFPAPPLRTSRAAYLVDRPGSAQANIVIANAGIRDQRHYFPLC